MLPIALVIAFQAGCVALVSLFLGFCCVPALHSPAREVLRPLALHHVESGLWAVQAAQRVASPPLTLAFKWSSEAVSVGFYVSAAAARGNRAEVVVVVLLLQAERRQGSGGTCCREQAATALPHHLLARRAPSCPCSPGWACQSSPGTWCCW